MSYPTLTLRDASRNSIASMHPWILVTSLQKTIQPIAKDSIVDIVDRDDRFLARGSFNPDSRIAVRVYSWNKDCSVDDELFDQRIEAAIALRKARTDFPSDSPLIARRLIFSEADRLSGLIVDAYGPYLIVQITASIMMAWLPRILDALAREFPSKGVLLRVDESTAAKEGILAKCEILSGEIPESGIQISENGLLFHVDLLAGQKTGHYLDQRQNREIAASLIPIGAKVLDVCSYSGGFACTIAKKVAGSEVTAIDSSQKALDLARHNAELNQLENVAFEKGDFYEALEKRLSDAVRYDAIVLDPPRMAGSRSQVERALAAYHRLNYQAVRLLKPGGILVTCSCSGRVDRQQFQHMLLGVSKRSRREIQILGQYTAADDHPCLVNCPETDYLKCVVGKIF